MQKHAALLLAFQLFLSAIAPSLAMGKEDSCENGECVEKLIDELDGLSSVYKSQCLPKKELSEQELIKFHEKYGLTEHCWRLLSKISLLEEKLQGHLDRLENKLGCENGACKGPNSPGDDLNSQLTALSQVEKKLSCNEAKKKEVRSKCDDDLKCAFFASAMGLGGYIAEKIVPDKFKMKDCHLGDDGCGVQLATGFLKAVVSFFEGAWGLLKMGGQYAGKKAGEFWNWVSGGDDHASTSQLAMAKASEEEGFFALLKKDFSGTMSKVFSGLVAALKEWFKNDVFCRKWSGVPHFSECKEPLDDYDCLSCKAMLNGVCSLTGTLVAEVIPAFLTGGLITAAKHGVNGAAKIAKLFKVSDATMKAMKSSRVGKMVSSATSKTDDILRVSKGLTAAKAAVTAAIAAIKAYLSGPTRKLLKASHSALTELTQKGKTFLVETKAGKIMVYGGTGLLTVGKVVIYPIENPMTVWAFKTGERSFDKVLRIGTPRLAGTSAATGIVLKQEPEPKQVIVKLEASRSPKADPKKVLQLEEEHWKLVEPTRTRKVDQILAQEKPDFDEIIKYFYPELQYGQLAIKLGPEKVRKAELELLDLIANMPNSGPAYQKMLKRYDQLVGEGAARNKIMGPGKAPAPVSSGPTGPTPKSSVAETEKFYINLSNVPGVSKGLGLNKLGKAEANRLKNRMGLILDSFKESGLDPKLMAREMGEKIAKNNKGPGAYREALGYGANDDLPAEVRVLMAQLEVVAAKTDLPEEQILEILRKIGGVCRKI